MKKSIVLFLVAFALAAAATLALRTARHEPYAAPSPAPETMAPPAQPGGPAAPRNESHQH
ncbi:MAG: hypothetical protein K0R17_418 [Rariglobus sp.]|jgi:hypothetical protein|nr:hypothetical protein [Rariglobus sp.]